MIASKKINIAGETVATTCFFARLTCIMMSYERPYPCEATERIAVEIRMPRQHEGIHRALKSSFGEVPPLPEEMAQLLSRLG